jgi:hypothetical protein
VSAHYCPEKFRRSISTPYSHLDRALCALRARFVYAGYLPGGQGHFFCLAKRNGPKEKATGLGAQARASVPCDARKYQRLRNSAALRPRTVLAECLVFSALLGTSHSVGEIVCDAGVSAIAPRLRMAGGSNARSAGCGLGVASRQRCVVPGSPGTSGRPGQWHQFIPDTNACRRENQPARLDAA